MPETARNFLRRRYAERRQTPFIPIALMGLPEIDPPALLGPSPAGRDNCRGEPQLAPASSDT